MPPYPTDSCLKMPGDILQNESGYNSSNDDHFSDAPEGSSEEDEPISNSSPPTTNKLPQMSALAPVADPEPPQRQQQEDVVSPARPNHNSISIPGAFGSDDEAFVVAAGSPESPTANPDDVAQRRGNAPPAELVVKWNEKTDTIVPKVRGERERIERLVQQQRARSRSLSTGTGPVRNTSTTLAGQVELGGMAFVNERPVAIMDQDAKLEQTGGDVETATAEEPPTPTQSTKTLSTDEQPDAGAIPYDPTRDGDDGFADDFDDFGDTVQTDAGDFNDFDDFEGFDGNFVEPEPVVPPPQAADLQPAVLLPDFGDIDSAREALTRALEKMFPTKDSERRKPTSVEGRSFLTERSLSLWNQLVAPPPLQPPNWKISRIRRLFLVSLGIPLDLDEILPTETKQKKLVLPSVHLPRHPDADSRPSSRNSRRSGSQSRRKKGEDKNQLSLEAFDIPSARILCSISTVALWNLTVPEIQEHIRKLEETTRTASEVLTYWLAKRDGVVGDKETFETVIESLVGYAKKQRQNG